MNSRSLLWPLAAALVLGACGGHGTRDLRPGGVALFAADAAIPIAVETRELGLPVETRGSRLLTGWRMQRSDGKRRLEADGEGARVEIVNLAARPRELVFSLTTPLVAGSAVLRLGGREISRVAVANPLSFTLPADLPIGTSALDLSFEPAAAAPTIAAAILRPSLAAGTAALGADGRLEQRGTSLIDVVRRLPAGWHLAGDVRLRAAGPVRLEVRDCADRLIEGRAWTGNWLERWRDHRFDVALPGGEARGAGDCTRIRLLVAGTGAASWRLLLQPPAAAADLRPSPPPAQPGASARPRLVVVYVMDAWRADFAGFSGGPAGLTPTLDALAAESLVAADHASVAPNTLPSTKALFTGRTYLAGGGAKLPADSPPTLAERFAERGYATGLFSGNVYVGAEYGLDRGFTHTAPEVQLEGYAARERPPFNDNAARVQRAAIAWLERLPKGQPAFLYLHTIHPHNPYDPPEPFRSRYLPSAAAGSTINGSTATLRAIKAGRLKPSPADQARLRGLYAGSVAYCDAQIAHFLVALRRFAPPEETVVAVTSDHGEELFDHGGVLHGYTLYQEMLRIPLLLWGPGRVPPGRLAGMTTTLDLRATLLQLVGDEADPRREAPEPGDGFSALLARSSGRSLLDLAAGRAPACSVRFAAAASVKGGIFAASSERWKVILAPRSGGQWGQGEGRGRGHDAEAVFDLAQDAGEMHNLAGDVPPLGLWTRQNLLDWIAYGLSRSPSGTEVTPDAETTAKLRALGYLD